MNPFLSVQKKIPFFEKMVFLPLPVSGKPEYLINILPFAYFSERL